jgi:hypothetical protein
MFFGRRAVSECRTHWRTRRFCSAGHGAAKPPSFLRSNRSGYFEARCAGMAGWGGCLSQAAESNVGKEKRHIVHRPRKQVHAQVAILEQVRVDCPRIERSKITAIQT